MKENDLYFDYYNDLENLTDVDLTLPVVPSPRSDVSESTVYSCFNTVKVEVYFTRAICSINFTLSTIAGVTQSYRKVGNSGTTPTLKVRGIFLAKRVFSPSLSYSI